VHEQWRPATAEVAGGNVEYLTGGTAVGSRTAGVHRYRPLPCLIRNLLTLFWSPVARYYTMSSSVCRDIISTERLCAHARYMLSQDVCPSVRPSVLTRHRVKMAKYIVEISFTAG